MPAIKVPRTLRIILVFIGVFLGLLAALIGSIVYTYQNRYYPLSKVGTVRMAGLAQAAGVSAVDAQVASYLKSSVVVAVPDISKPRDTVTGEFPEVEVPTTAADLGLAYASQAAVQDAWRVGHDYHPLVWIKDMYRIAISGNAHNLPYSVDGGAVEDFINTAVLAHISAPVPAKIAIEGAAVRVDDQKPGLSVDTAALTNQVAQSLSTATDGDAIYLRAMTSVVDSTTTALAVQPIATQLDRLGGLSLNLATVAPEDTTIPYKPVKLKPKREEILTWFSPAQNDQGQLVLNLNQDKVAAYLSKSGGKLIDQKLALKDTLSLLTPLISASTVPKAIQTVNLVAKPAPVGPTVPADSGGYTLNRYAGKYVEVSLKDQRLYAINAGVLEATYIVSTGKWSTPTPQGEFKISSKIARAYSRTFKLYMPYWQAFLNNEYGLHELPEWPNGYKEGESHLGTPVSHGCIRLGVGDAASLYNWTEIGTPVVVHN